MPKKNATSDFILWNAFPWHPYNPAAGSLSNRPPTPAELMEGIAPFKALLLMTSVKTVATLGIMAKKLADTMGIEAYYLRHPASGGAAQFREQCDRYSLSVA